MSDGIWVTNLAGEKAYIEDTEQDRWSLHGWTASASPADRDFVWMRKDDVDGAGLVAWGAREYWQGIGWSPAAPPEPFSPTRDPALVDGAEAPPEGTVAEVTGWVGDDPARAEAALLAERKRDTPRTTLVDSLQKVGQGDVTQSSAAPAAPNKEA